MSARLGLRTWLTLSAVVVILLFATVAADAKLQGTRPPSSLSVNARTAASPCRDGEICVSRKGSNAKAAGHRRGDDCSTPLSRTL